MRQRRQEVSSQALARLGNIRSAVQLFVQDDKGVTAVEYGLLAALIVLVASSSIVLLGGGVGGMWTLISTTVGAAL